MIKEPNSLLATLFKAKYFKNSTILDATLGHRPSHAWKSIYEGDQFLKQGIRWRLGDGNTIKVWKDNRIGNPPRTARPRASIANDQLVVLGLLQHQKSWDTTNISEVIHMEDVPFLFDPSINQQKKIVRITKSKKEKNGFISILSVFLTLPFSF